MMLATLHSSQKAPSSPEKAFSAAPPQAAKNPGAARRLLILSLALFSPALFSCSAEQNDPSETIPDSPGYCDVIQIIETQCTSCHSGETPQADLDLSLNPHSALVGTSSRLYPGNILVVPGDPGSSLLYAKVSNTQSPEQGDPMPFGSGLEDEEATVFRDWILEGAGSQCESDGTSENSGTVTLHRLNRSEYNNTVRDLLGTTLTPADNFPSDDLGYGFDNIAEVLSLSPLHIELYEVAVDELLEELLPPPSAETWFFEAEEASANTGGIHYDWGWNVWSAGEVYELVEIPIDGEYEVKANVLGQQAGDENVEMVFTFDAQVLDTFEVANTELEEYASVVQLEAGLHSIGIGFTNDYYEPELGDDRNLIVDWFSVEGPINVDTENPQRDAVFTCTPDPSDPLTCAREILDQFVPRAWRRPTTDTEIDSLIQLTEMALEDGSDFDESVSLALKAVMMSPHFIFRVEIDPEPSSTEIHSLDDYELANRLSYFLWSSMPDDELFQLASEGVLHEPDVLAGQVDRMLNDSRSFALVENLAGQWLYIRDIQNAFPDIWVYPQFDESLRDAMIGEMQFFFDSFITEDKDMRELLTADSVMVNDRLAEHYGLTTTLEDGFEALDGSDVHRGGILTQAGLLTVLSSPARTSIVRRGKWVLEQLLCDAPEDPPPGVEGDLPQDSEDSESALSLREQLELHREDPSCAVCHTAMDPIGFGLENYDGIGAWRDEDNGSLIDASGELPGGLAFEGALELSEIIAADPRYSACIVENVFIYALGRGPLSSDDHYLNAIRSAFEGGGFKFSSLAKAIVTSEPFRYRHGLIDEEETP